MEVCEMVQIEMQLMAVLGGGIWWARYAGVLDEDVRAFVLLEERRCGCADGRQRRELHFKA
jgi:hypothetical protein